MCVRLIVKRQPIIHTEEVQERVCVCAVCYHHMGNDSDDDILPSFGQSDDIFHSPPFTLHVTNPQQQLHYHFSTAMEVMSTLWATSVDAELAKVKGKLKDLNVAFAAMKAELKELKEDKGRKDKQVSINFEVGIASHLPFVLESSFGLSLGPKERFCRKLMRRPHYNNNNPFDQMDKAIEDNEAFVTERGRLSQRRQGCLQGDTPSIEFNLLCFRKKHNKVIVFEAIATSELRGHKLLAKVLQLERQLTLLSKMGHAVEMAGIVSPAFVSWSDFSKKNKIRSVCPADAIPQISELAKHNKFHFVPW